jgi:hypothetical protein
MLGRASAPRASGPSVCPAFDFSHLDQGLSGRRGRITTSDWVLESPEADEAADAGERLSEGG